MLTKFNIPYALPLLRMSGTVDHAAAFPFNANVPPMWVNVTNTNPTLWFIAVPAGEATQSFLLRGGYSPCPRIPTVSPYDNAGTQFGSGTTVIITNGSSPSTLAIRGVNTNLGNIFTAPGTRGGARITISSTLTPAQLNGAIAADILFDAPLWTPSVNQFNVQIDAMWPTAVFPADDAVPRPSIDTMAQVYGVLWLTRQAGGDAVMRAECMAALAERYASVGGVLQDLGDATVTEGVAQLTVTDIVNWPGPYDGPIPEPPALPPAYAYNPTRQHDLAVYQLQSGIFTPDGIKTAYSGYTSVRRGEPHMSVINTSAAVLIPGGWWALGKTWGTTDGVLPATDIAAAPPESERYLGNTCLGSYPMTSAPAYIHPCANFLLVRGYAKEEYNTAPFTPAPSVNVSLRVDVY